MLYENHRAAYEAALGRAGTALRSAAYAAETSTDIGAAEDVHALQREVRRLLEASLESSGSSKVRRLRGHTRKPC